MTFAWLWAFALLPLPWIIRRWVKPVEAGDRVEHPLLYQWANSSPQGAMRIRRKGLWLWLAWAMLVLALARPQTPGPLILPDEPARHLMLVLDLSLSMEEPDMTWQGAPVSRYYALQRVVDEFLQQRQGDAVGVAVFGDFAAIHTPLTPDIEAVRAMIDELRPGMAGRQTAMGDGIGLAVQRLRDYDAPDKVIILLSDGDNNAGELDPLEAARAAAASDIRVYSIAFGGERQSGVFGFFQGAQMDEAQLQRLSDMTGGQFFRARSSEELLQAYQRIGELESGQFRTLPQRQVQEHFVWPVLAALGLVVVGGFWNSRRATA